MRLSEKTAIITGGAGGIGVAAGALFAREGANVLLVDLSEDGLKEAVSAINSPNVSYTVADVTQPNQVEAYVHVAMERYGGIHIFLNNAGFEGVIQSIVDCPIEAFDQVIEVNVRGAWLGLKYVIPAMEKSGGGSIIITSSISGVRGSANFTPYVTSKHAVIGMMRCAALECAPLNIRVNTVNPSPIETRMMRSIEEQQRPGEATAAKEGMVQRNPFKRYGEPEEVANLMLFLASDESQFCNGGVYMIDGGWTA